MWKMSEFLSENFPFLVVKFSIYLNRHVFVMIQNFTSRMVISVRSVIFRHFSSCHIFVTSYLSKILGHL